MHASAFTLIEILISLALLTILFSIGLYVSLGSYRQSLAYSQIEQVVAALATARESSMNNIDQRAWSAYGVTFSQLSGATASTSITITGNTGTSTIFINEAGAIDW